MTKIGLNCKKSLALHKRNNRSQMRLLKIFILVFATFIAIGSSSRVIFPPGLPDINTPLMTNGFVGGIPSNFTITANLTIIGYGGCDPFQVPEGNLVLVNIGPCNIDVKIKNAINSGAVGVLVNTYEPPGVGRKSRAPLQDTPLNFPAVVIGMFDYFMLLGINTTIVMEITPGYSDWHVLIFDTAWFLAVNIFFAAAYLVLLALVIRKFVLKIRRSGFVWNVGFVYLMFQGLFCALVFIRWIDPLVGRGIFIIEMDSFFDLFPSTLAFTALLLMAFFWFEVINQFADMKVTPFLSKKLRNPFWVAASIIMFLPFVNILVLIQSPVIEPFIAISVIIMAAGAVVGAFYIVVAIKALKVLARSRRLNIDKKSRVKALAKLQVSIILSCVIACIYPFASFFLRYFGIMYNSWLYFAILLEESFLLGVVVFIQVWFMPSKSSHSSATKNTTTGSDQVRSKDSAAKPVNDKEDSSNTASSNNV